MLGPANGGSSGRKEKRETCVKRGRILNSLKYGGSRTLTTTEMSTKTGAKASAKEWGRKTTRLIGGGSSVAISGLPS